jgi:hypothetical protein
VGQWDVVSSGDAGSDVLGSEREGPPRGPRRVVALGTAFVLVCAFAATSWVASSWWQRHRATAADAHVATVSFALLGGSVANGNDPGAQEVSWTALVVNTGPSTVTIASADWGGEDMPSAAHLALKPHDSRLLVFTSSFGCALDGTTTTLPIPTATLRLRTADGAGVVRDVEVLNPTVWTSTVFQACSQVASNVESSVYPSGEATVRLEGKVLVVHLVVVNQGPVEAGTTIVSVVGDGFVSTSSPAQITQLAPGASAPVDVRVEVADCALASSGDIQGIEVTPTGEFGPDATLIRGMDRLVHASCPQPARTP